MASITLHKFIERIRGQFGDIVVKKMNGHMFIAKPPDRSNIPPPTQAQIDVRNRFALASAYAKGALQDPVSRQFYEALGKAKGLPTISAAASDFLKPPVVGLVDTGAYHGRTGDKITILATDDAAVVSVDVVIRAAN